MLGRIHSVLFVRRAAALLAILLIGGCAGTRGSGPSQPADARSACSALDRSLGKSEIGVPLDGVRIESAVRIDADGPAFCKVTGSIAAAQGSGVAPQFEVHLPDDWNGHAVQFGDGIQGKRLPADPAGNLMASYGYRGGGATGNVAATGEVALAAQKQLRNAAAELLARRYDRFPDKFYLLSAEGGGAAAVALAARYPRLFRGVLADGTRADGSPSHELSTTTTLAEFESNGGKLIIIAAPDGDAKGAASVVALYRAIAARIGQRSVDGFIRLYRAPAAAQPQVLRLLTMLVDWAENGKPPAASGDLPGPR